jgi:hypothetical protein
MMRGAEARPFASIAVIMPVQPYASSSAMSTPSMQPSPAPPADATRGGLGMLERPSEEGPSEEGGLLDGEPPVTFPPGFPLVNNFEEDFDAKPAASEEQIAMLTRMFGGA